MMNDNHKKVQISTYRNEVVKKRTNKKTNREHLRRKDVCF